MPFAYIGTIPSRPSIGEQLGSILGKVAGFYLGKRLHPLLDPDISLLQEAVRKAREEVSQYESVEMPQLSSASEQAQVTPKPNVTNVPKHPLRYLAEVSKSIGEHVMQKNPVLGNQILGNAAQLYGLYEQTKRSEAEIRNALAEAEKERAMAQYYLAKSMPEKVEPPKIEYFGDIPIVRSGEDIKVAPFYYIDKGIAISGGGVEVKPIEKPEKAKTIKDILSPEEQAEFEILSDVEKSLLLKEIETSLDQPKKGKKQVYEEPEKAKDVIKKWRAYVKAKKAGLLKQESKQSNQSESSTKPKIRTYNTKTGLLE